MQNLDLNQSSAAKLIQPGRLTYANWQTMILDRLQGDRFMLSQLIIIKDEKLYDADKIVHDVGNICNWVNDEYEYLDSKKRVDGNKGVLKAI